MNENEFELDGKRYRAVETDDYDCESCAFASNQNCNDMKCLKSTRADGRMVYFVEVKP